MRCPAQVEPTMVCPFTSTKLKKKDVIKLVRASRWLKASSAHSNFVTWWRARLYRLELGRLLLPQVQ